MKKTLLFDFEKCDFVTKNGDVETVCGADALKAWIQKILRTEFGRYKIYNGTSYGVDIYDIITGKTYSRSFAEAELRREITEALMQNDDIINVLNVETQSDGSLIKITVKLNTVYGNMEEMI